MALNFSVSYTFSPNTTILSSQVNTNTSDVANVFNGLEAETKTLAKLKVDIDPTLALEVATKQYVDHYSTYRRPVLVYNSTTVVNIETGLDGTSGDCKILFPDGNLRIDSTTTRIRCNLAQVAALSGTAQSGLRTGTVGANTIYAIYAVKTTDNVNNFVAVADVVPPIQANFATLNSNFGTSGWVYLGMVRCGDGTASGTSILTFAQNGNHTVFRNGLSSHGFFFESGYLLATTASASSLAWGYSAGMTTSSMPAHITLADIQLGTTGGAWGYMQSSLANTVYGVFGLGGASGLANIYTTFPILDGALATLNGAAPADITCSGWWDPVLGIGSNPLL